MSAGVVFAQFLKRTMRRAQRLFVPAGDPETLYGAYVRNALGEYPAGDYVPIAAEPPPPGDVKLVAYYLPQFHPIPENNEWWGKGFTEWRNVTRAFPVFDGHYQPRTPGELGYYDLRVPDVMRRQVELAKLYGISAFCFHFYWFEGRRLLELPIANFLADSSLDLPFSLCWANEPWSRRWSGREQDVLMPQRHSPEDDIALIRYLDKYFSDSRYLRIDGKPVFTVYRPSLLPDPAETVGRWREEMARLGYPGIYLIATNAFDFTDAHRFGFDALSEFPPHGIDVPNIESSHEVSPLREGGRVRSYEAAVASQTTKSPGPSVVHPGVMPSWDNSPRRPKDSVIYHGATPVLFRQWLDHAMEHARRNPEGERLVFINAWNEWAEGACLEPDQRFGYGYLDACACAVRDDQAGKQIANWEQGEQMSEQPLRFADLEWDGDELMSVGGVRFNLSTSDFTRKTTDQEVVLLKNPIMLQTYRELFHGSDVRNILEFGTWEGGSPLFFAAATNARRIVGIDLRDPADNIQKHAARFPERLKLVYQTSQSDRDKVHNIIDEGFDGPIDLVIDDASHHYEHTKAAFEIAFSRLKVGGTYVIENWSWAHYANTVYDDLWKDQKALSNLALEIVMAVGSSSAIKSIEVRNWCLIIRKGAEVSRDFRLDEAIRLSPRRKFEKF